MFTKLLDKNERVIDGLIFRGKMAYHLVKYAHKNQIGAFGLKTVLMLVIMGLVIGNVIAAVWSDYVGTDTAIQALTETDDATVFLQTGWPLYLLIIGIVIVAGLLMYAVRKAGLV